MKQRNWLSSLLLVGFLLLPATALALSEADFKPLTTGGFGDSANSYSWGLAEHNGDVYVSTGRHHFWSMMMAMGSLIGGVIDPGDFIEGPPGFWGDLDWADTHRAEIWRLRNGRWQRVCQSETYYIPEDQAIVNPLLPTPLFGYFPNAYSYRTLGTFGDHIYALGVGTWMPPIANTSIIRSASGDLGTWEDVTGNLASTTNIRGFKKWRDHVYVAVATRGSGTSGAGGCVVYRNNDAYPSTGERWEAVSDVGFGDLRNEEIYYLQVFNDCLYASTVNYVNGFEVWKTNGTIGPDGKFVWTQVIKDGFGDTWCQYGMHMEPFGNYLYVGTAVGAGMVMKDQQPVGIRALDIIRIDKNDNAQLVVGSYEPSDPPTGWPTSRIPLSMLPAGFGNPLNVYSWHMGVYKDWLVVGTFDMTGIVLFFIKDQILSDPAAAMAALQSLQGSSNSIPPEQLEALQNLDLLDSIDAETAGQIIDYLLNTFGGGDLWKTKDGINWTPVTLSGLNNWHNYGFRRVVPVQLNGEEILFLGTSNPFTGVEGGGCEVWANLPAPTPDGDINGDGIIDRSDANIINANRDKPATAYPECDIDGDGVITILDARKLTTMCTYPRCASVPAP
jgi:hypothetical protein